MRRAIVAAAALTLAACSDTTLPTEEWIRARAAGQETLAITNRGDEPVYVQVSDPTELAVLMGCSPQSCTRIDPRATIRVGYSAIQNYDAGDRQAAVNWWVFTDEGGTRDTGTIVTDL